jgi:transposase-like protein
MAALVAVGVAATGERRILGLELGPTNTFDLVRLGD